MLDMKTLRSYPPIFSYFFLPLSSLCFLFPLTATYFSWMDIVSQMTTWSKHIWNWLKYNRSIYSSKKHGTYFSFVVNMHVP